MAVSRIWMRWTLTKLVAVVAVAGAMVAVACGGSAVQPSVLPVEISCPTAPQVNSADGKSVAVSFTAPTSSGGKAPLTTTCTPTSGTLFNVGSTLVRCSARDVERRSAECAFSVTVSRTPQLSVTKFMAFGDSITAGVIATDCGASTGISCTLPTLNDALFSVADDLRARYPGIGEVSPSAYPRQLVQQLAARYSSQALVMSNQGEPGELITAGRTRLSGTLTANVPEVLLLLEGANDMNQQKPVAGSLADLRTMVRDARGRGITVFLATLLPQRAGACRAQDFCNQRYETPELNDQLRTMAAAEGAVLVDLFPLFDGKLNTLLGIDGLHPNDAGYKVIADAFFAAIKTRFEN